MKNHWKYDKMVQYLHVIHANPSDRLAATLPMKTAYCLLHRVCWIWLVSFILDHGSRLLFRYASFTTMQKLRSSSSSSLASRVVGMIFGCCLSCRVLVCVIDAEVILCSTKRIMSSWACCGSLWCSYGMDSLWFAFCIVPVSLVGIFTVVGLFYISKMVERSRYFF